MNLFIKSVIFPSFFPLLACSVIVNEGSLGFGQFWKNEAAWRRHFKFGKKCDDGFILSALTTWLLEYTSLSWFLLCYSRPPGWKHRHTVPDQQSRARQDSQTVDQTLRHIISGGAAGRMTCGWAGSTQGRSMGLLVVEGGTGWIFISDLKS